MRKADEKMLQEIHEDLAERMSTQVNSMCATPDEVRIAWLLCHIDDLNEIIAEVHSWAVCSAIATPEDMMQNIGRIGKITAPEYDQFKDKCGGC